LINPARAIPHSGRRARGCTPLARHAGRARKQRYIRDIERTGTAAAGPGAEKKFGIEGFMGLGQFGVPPRDPGTGCDVTIATLKGLPGNAPCLEIARNLPRIAPPDLPPGLPA
jgi:hypothetical protein